tara:strand:+ start:1842 stop:2408 length:567 start_codon:yes stop_codon:yes gene_type:complete
MYKLYTDKIENFEAKIKLEGASLKKSKARLIIESDDFDLMFKGTISESGKVKIPVKRLRGLLDENMSGKIKLEVIAEDTYFIPWESTFKVQASKKVTVEIKSQSKPTMRDTEPTIQVLSQKKVTISEKQHVINIVRMLIKENINIKNLSIKKDKLNNIVAEYISENTISQVQKIPVINNVIKVLKKRK